MLTIEDEEELQSFIEKEKLLKQYQKKLIELSYNDEYKESVMNETIEQNAMFEQTYGVGYRRGVEEGIEQGVLNTKKELIVNMYNDNISLDLISKYTNLSINEIRNIIDNK